MESQYKDLSSHYISKDDGYYDFARPEMIEFIPNSSKRILEIGCSGGGFGSLLKKERPGIEVWGVEPNENAAKKARERLDRVICGTFHVGLAELENQHFDCVVFNDVLEHLVNPETALVDSKQFLTEDGVIVASIPNILHFYQIWSILKDQDWKYADSGILDSTHLRFFTKKSIIRLFEQSGFGDIEIRGIYPSYGLKYWAFNLITFGRLYDWRFVQFGVIARPSK